MNKDPFREETLDIKKLIFKYARFWYWFVISLIIALTIAYFVNKFSETVYRTRATVLIRDDRKGGFRPGQIMGEMDLFYQRNNIFNEMAVLRSYSLVDSALRKMDVEVSYYNIGRLVGEMRTTEIYKNTPFLVYWDRTLNVPYNRPFHVKVTSEDTYEIHLTDGKRFRFRNSEVSTPLNFGDIYEADGYKIRIRKNDNFTPASHVGREYLFVINSLASLSSQYINALSVAPLNNEVSIVQLAFEATNPERAVDFLNAITEVYLQQSLYEKNEIAENTILFIDKQIDVISDSLVLAESSLEDFRQRNQLMEVGAASSQFYAELQQLDNSRAIENLKRQYYEYLLGYIDNEKDFRDVFSPSALGIEDALLNRLISELSGLFSERARLSELGTMENPSLLNINRQISLSLRALKENLYSIQNASDILMADLDKRIARVEERINQMPGTAREFIGIERRFNLSNSTYNYLLEKRAEAGIAMASNVPDHKIVDRARYTSIVAPKEQRNYTFALVAGLIIPLALILLRDFFDSRIQDKKEVTDAVDFPILGVIPHNRAVARLDSVNLVVFEETKSPVTEAFRAMRTNLQYFATTNKNKVIAITSTRSKEGKTFTAINLASVIALSGKKTVLIGADLRKPRIFDDFQIDQVPGLSNYLVGTNTLQEITQKVEYSPFLHIISAGPVPPNPSELLESDKMYALLQILKEEYDFVIIDTPPIGIVPDGINLIKNSDIAVFIIRQKFSDKSSLEFLNDFAAKIDAKNICIEINDVKLSKSGYGYGYGLGYGYGYGYGNYEENPLKKKNVLKKWYDTVYNGFVRKS
jgi:tyrosine-protein kinase Etk/Wzc